MSDKLPDKKLPVIHTAEVVARSRLFQIEQIELEFSNGEQRVFERMKSSGRGAVMIVPVNAQNELLLVREYAAGTHNYQLGFPKGLIDPGETPIEAANRELKEEVGFGARQFSELKTLCLAPGYFGAYMHILLAHDLYPEKLEGDEPEPLDVVNWPIDQSETLIAREDFSEARSLAALFMAQRVLAQK